MTTERYAWYSSQPRVVTAAFALHVCGCGQELDGTARSNCTRCGVPVVPVHAHPERR